MFFKKKKKQCAYILKLRAKEGFWREWRAYSNVPIHPSTFFDKVINWFINEDSYIHLLDIGDYFEVLVRSDYEPNNLKCYREGVK